MLVSKSAWRDKDRRLKLPEGTIINAPRACCVGTFPRVRRRDSLYDGHKGNPMLVCPTCFREFKTIK